MNVHSSILNKLEGAAIKLPLPKNNDLLKTQSVEYENLDYQTFLDVEASVYNEYVTPIYDVTVTNEYRTTVDGIQNDLMLKSDEFMNYAYNNKGEFDASEFNNFISDLHGVLDSYSYQVNTLNSLSATEKEVLNIALMAANISLHNDVVNFETNFQSIIDDYNAQIVNNKNGIQIEGLFGWIKKNIIAPIVTFVVTVVVAVGVLIATTVVGFAIGGPVGGLIGVAAGLTAAYFTRNPVRRFLEWADLYAPYADVYEYN